MFSLDIKQSFRPKMKLNDLPVERKWCKEMKSRKRNRFFFMPHRRTVALNVTQVNDFDINLSMHNRCIFGSCSYFISFKCFLTWDGSKNIARKVHPAVDLLSLFPPVRHCSASLHMLRQKHSKLELAGNINSNCIAATNSKRLTSNNWEVTPAWNVNMCRRSSN